MKNYYLCFVTSWGEVYGPKMEPKTLYKRNAKKEICNKKTILKLRKKI